MATTDYWAPAPLCRDQATLFAPTLEAVIAKDDPVRMVDEVLSAIDWTEWEAGYNGTRGQPAIHPRHLAACWLYGLCRGIRSSRKLEEVEAAEQRECLDGSPTQLPPELANLDRRRQI